METVAMVLELALLALVWFLGLPAACRVVPHLPRGLRYCR